MTRDNVDAGKVAKKRPEATPATPPKRAVDVRGTATPAAASPVAASKAKLVRDSFTIPKDEYMTLTALKERAAHLRRPIKKSELLRAGIVALLEMSDRSFLATLRKVPTLKTGRPKDPARE